MTRPQLQLGAATITILDAGELEARLDQWFAATVQPVDRERFTKPIRIPIQCIHLALPTMSVLVDAACYDFAADYPYRPADYNPPPGIVAQLATVGIMPEAMTHVVITHAHGDHFNGTTVQQDGEWVPTFPQARHYLGRADWVADDLQAALRIPDSLEARTLGVLERHGLLELVDGDQELGSGVRLIATPGESPGHQIVQFSSGSETLYCLGDLYHHLVEVEQPAYLPWWADAERMNHSRRQLIASAVREQALLIATHISGVGQIAQTSDGLRWLDITGSHRRRS